jgi:hypothetical protein
MQDDGDRGDDQHAAATGRERADHPAHEAGGEQREIGKAGSHGVLSSSRQGTRLDFDQPCPIGTVPDLPAS